MSRKFPIKVKLIYYKTEGEIRDGAIVGWDFSAPDKFYLYEKFEENNWLRSRVVQVFVDNQLLEPQAVDAFFQYLKQVEQEVMEGKAKIPESEHISMIRKAGFDESQWLVCRNHPQFIEILHKDNKQRQRINR